MVAALECFSHSTQENESWGTVGKPHWLSYPSWFQGEAWIPLNCLWDFSAFTFLLAHSSLFPVLICSAGSCSTALPYIEYAFPLLKIVLSLFERQSDRDTDHSFADSQQFPWSRQGWRLEPRTQPCCPMWVSGVQVLKSLSTACQGEHCHESGVLRRAGT